MTLPRLKILDFFPLNSSLSFEKKLCSIFALFIFRTKIAILFYCYSVLLMFDCFAHLFCFQEPNFFQSKFILQFHDFGSFQLLFVLSYLQSQLVLKKIFQNLQNDRSSAHSIYLT